MTYLKRSRYTQIGLKVSVGLGTGNLTFLTFLVAKIKVAYCFFANIGKKFMNRLGGSPCPSVGDYLTGCTTCTNTQGTPTGCTACTKRQKVVLVQQEPDLGCSQGELRSAIGPWLNWRGFDSSRT